MRWFVEVSRLGENGVAEEYCVEAKQWQAALQEARKLRGDSGALAQFSIELLDHGYRAVDPSLKLRYLVTQAPDTATVTGSSTPFTPAISPAQAGPASLVPRPGSSSPPRPLASVAPRASNAAPRLQQLLVPDDPVPPAPPAPGSLAPVALADVAPAPSIEASPSLAQSLPSPQPALVAALLPSFEVVRERSEEARADSPITYRELAFAVAPGVTREQVEALLHDRYQATRATIEDRPAGKFVQLAVFDHVFKRKPERPPVATFSWKDWRGAPILAFPGFGEAAMGPMSQVPPAPASSMPPANGTHSVRPSAAASLSMLPLPASLAPSASAPAPAVSLPDAPQGSLAPAPMLTLQASPHALAPPAVQASVASAVAALLPVAAEPVALVAEPASVAAEPAPVVSEPASVVVEPAPVVAAPAPVSSPGFELHFDSTPFNAVPVVASKAERVSRPRLAVVGRRRAGEDLIGELFEFMHELHFQRDVATGADFVLSVLNEVLPCEGVLIHVFDINTGHFVVVRAKGPNASSVLLQRMPDQDAFVQSVMRSPRSVSVNEAASDARFNGPRWHSVGVAPKYALAGAVQLGGRYLGLIELVNPQGDTPFHTSELNALDYICEQFADFLSKKPLVLAADVVLARV
jgi:hypothetical protein